MPPRRDSNNLPRVNLRQLRFAAAHRVGLPIGVPILKAMVASWRPVGPEPEPFGESMAAPRVVMVTFHGMMLHLLRFTRIPDPYGRRLVVMLSPSLDGRLLAEALEHFGLGHVFATTGSRSIAGSREFIRAVEDGNIGIVAADGPRGPCCIANRGFLQLAAGAKAHLLLATTSAGPGLRFGSWDRSHLPLPFSRVQLSLKLLPPPTAPDDPLALQEVQDALLTRTREISSPVLPVAMRAKQETS